MQSSETLRNSLGLNYKSAALTNWAMPALPHMKAVLASSSRVRPMIGCITN